MQAFLEKKIKKLSDSLTIGERIASVRKLRNFSQVALAQQSGRTRSAIAQIETNAMRPDYEFIKDIVRILNTTYEYIFGEVESPEKGVRYSDEKGGKVMGKVTADIQNDLYIKRRKSGKLYPDTGLVTKEEPIHQVSDIERADYRDLRRVLETSMKQQGEVMQVILSRLQALEERLPDQAPAELPGGEKSGV